MMVRRDFELIANTILKLALTESEKEQVAMMFAMALGPQCPGFNFPKFIQEATGKTLVP